MASARFDGCHSLCVARCTEQYRCIYCAYIHAHGCGGWVSDAQPNRIARFMADAGWGSHHSSLLGTGVGLAQLLGTPVANSVHSQGGGGRRLSGRAAIAVTSGLNPRYCGRHATHRGTGGGRPAPLHNAVLVGGCPCATIKRSLLAEGVAVRGGRDLDAPAGTLRGPGAHGDDAHWPERPTGTRAGGGDTYRRMMVYRIH